MYCQSSTSASTHWDQLKLDDVVHEFRGVMSQQKELVHRGDFVKLCSTQHGEVQK